MGCVILGGHGGGVRRGWFVIETEVGTMSFFSSSRCRWTTLCRVGELRINRALKMSVRAK